MAYQNGSLPKKALASIGGGLFLAVKTARAWKRLVADAKKELGRAIAPAAKAGAYRSRLVQKLIRAAFFGTAADKAAWNLDRNSTVPPSMPGGSTHGWGTTVDIVGTPIDHAFVRLAARHGFTFPFGDRDPRHALHDGKTSTAPFILPKPAPKKLVYVVKSGDTLGAIAELYRTSVPKLLTLNSSTIHDPDEISVAQKIRIR